MQRRKDETKENKNTGEEGRFLRRVYQGGRGLTEGEDTIYGG